MKVFFENIPSESQVKTAQGKAGGAKRIALFGSTGSIGTQALNVIGNNPDKFSAEVLTAQSNDELLIQQALQFNPNIVVIGDETKFQKVKEALSSTDIKVFCGEKALEEVAAMDVYDLMLAAIVGFAGLRPTLKAIENSKTIALANKETLVVAGDIIMQRAMENRAPVIPVDSEHSAIFQCLVGETRNRIEKIILTASGGPFLGRKPNFLVNVKREHALQHPNWSMGAKISIDSATLMNKGLEMIEAKYLFNLRPDQQKNLLGCNFFVGRQHIIRIGDAVCLLNFLRFRESQLCFACIRKESTGHAFGDIVPGHR